MQLRPSHQRPFLRLVLTLAVLCCLTAPAFAGVSFYYEKVTTDAWGNEIGYQTVLVTSIDQLPVGSPWRAYFSNQVGGRNLWEYSQAVAGSLSKQLIVTFSDRNQISSSYRSTAGYNIKLYRHVTQYTSNDSKKFVYLHEMGHVAMLNAYGGNYTFSGLNYGSDNIHTLDEILPNANTAWVEGWANAFGALKNGGKLFSLSFDSDTTTAFLVDNTFEQMTRNELFVGKMLYDIMMTFPSGRDKVFNLLSTTGPHASLRDFCRAYVKTYPADQVALAKLLDKIGYSKASLNEVLDYLNGGSRTVTREFYAYLQQRGSIAGGSGTGSTTSSQTTSTKKSFWSRIADFFSGLFGNRGSTSTSAAAPQPSVTVGAADTQYGQVYTSHSSDTSLAPVAPGENLNAPREDSAQKLSAAQEEFFAAFAAYNEALSRRPADPAAVRAALERFKAAKAALTSLKDSIGQ